MRRKYRVTLPIDLGDGVIHNFGEVLQLELEQTAGYEHALIAVEEEADGGNG